MQVESQTRQAAIFDMDGVLIDSVRLNWQAMNNVLSDYNVQITDKDVKKYLGRTLRDQVAQLNADFGLHLNYDEFEEATRAIKVELFAKLSPKEGVVEILDLLRAQNTPTAVATSMPRELTEQRLRTAGILDYFDVVVTEEDVTKHKPDPEVFTKAAERLGATASQCVVFEDAPAGVEAAKAAGMKCVAVRTAYVPIEELGKADVKVNSLSQFDITEFDRLASV